MRAMRIMTVPEFFEQRYSRRLRILTGVLVALVILGVVLFALPPTSRLWVAGVILVMALLVKGGDAAKLIDQARVKIYGG